MVQRISWASRLFGKAQGDRGPLRYNVYDLLKAAPTPDGIVHRLLVLFDATMTPAHRSLLVEAAAKASNGALTQENANFTAAAVCRLMFGSPEFQMC